MISTSNFLSTLRHRGIGFFCGVPDSLLKELCACIESECSDEHHVICANEGSAIAVAAGHHLGSGKIAAVYMQNSGLGNAVNPLLSLADRAVYSIPMLLIIGWRGEPGIHDEPQHVKQGEVTESLLQCLNIPFRILDSETDYEPILAELLSLAASESRPVALLVKKKTFARFSSPQSTDPAPTQPAFLREAALDIILQYMGDSLIVSTTGKSSRELYELREKRGETQRDFLTVGSMGHSSSIATGIALANPSRRLICIDGDAALIMHMGSLAVIGKLAPRNLIHILINNGCHESVGGQPSAASNMDFAALAQATGYPHYFSADSPATLESALAQIIDLPGPILLEIRVKPGSRADLGRPKASPLDCKHNFMMNHSFLLLSTVAQRLLHSSSFIIHYSFLIAMLLAPNVIFAYLDPGSGAVLVNLLIAGIAALLFSLKGIFLRLIGKKEAERPQPQKSSKIAILSEGRQYWATFSPIIEALIAKEMDFSYYSLDITDPALKIENPHMRARFLGFGYPANYRASRIKAEYLLCTTPNIGSPGYPIQKSPRVKQLIHIFHSINDLAMYRKGSLDHYDAVYMLGDWQAKSIRELEAKRGLPPKKLHSLGLPYLDVYQKDARPSERGSKPCVLVASSWGQKGLLMAYGVGFVEALAERYRVILRPHPQSYQSEPKAMAAFEKALAGHQVIWDRELSPVDSMRQADILISDTSSIRFDYAFLYQRPVITLEIEAAAMPGYELDDLDEIWMDSAASQIGKLIKKSDIDALSEIVRELLDGFDPRPLIEFRERTIVNFGQAGKAIAEHLGKLVCHTGSG